MKYLMLLATVMLTGCATPPQWLATAYNNADPCQRPPYASFCGASAGQTVIMDSSGRITGYVRKTR